MNIQEPFNTQQNQQQRQQCNENAPPDGILINKSRGQLKNLYKMLCKKSLSKKIFEFYIYNETAPKEISLSNFPVPFLAHDDTFVKSYDTLIKSFQRQIMDLCMQRVEEQSVTLNNRIDEIKNALIDKIEDIDTFVNDKEKKIQETWKPIIETSLEKASHIVVK